MKKYTKLKNKYNYLVINSLHIFKLTNFKLTLTNNASIFTYHFYSFNTIRNKLKSYLSTVRHSKAVYDIKELQGGAFWRRVISLFIQLGRAFRILLTYMLFNLTKFRAFIFSLIKFSSSIDRGIKSNL